jgi:TonB family protein
MKRNVLRMAAAIALLLTAPAFLAPVRAAPQDKPEPSKIIRRPGAALQLWATKRVKPVYPPQAKAAGIHGRVVVEVTIDETGKVISARAASGHPLLKDAAVEAARGWTFPPMTLHGKPIKVSDVINIIFRLPPTKSIYQQKLAANPDAPGFYYMLGWTYANAEQYEEALEVFQKALALRPDSGEAQYAIASMLAKLERLDEALEAFKQAFALGLTDEKKARAYTDIGMAQFEARHYQEAIKALKQALAIDPYPAPSYLTHFYVGLAYLKLGDYDSALSEYRFLDNDFGSVYARMLMEQINIDKEK